jgi:hypothetical protein
VQHARVGRLGPTTPRRSSTRKPVRLRNGERFR